MPRFTAYRFILLSLTTLKVLTLEESPSELQKEKSDLLKTKTKKSNLVEFLPNCYDNVFLKYGGSCSPELVPSSIDQRTVDLANCMLKDLPHLNRPLITCEANQPSCKSSLTSAQRDALRLAMNKMGMLCAVHKFRRNKLKLTEEFKEISSTVQGATEHIQSISEMVVKAEEENRVKLEDLTAASEKSKGFEELEKLEKQSESLHREIEEVSVSLSTAGTFDLSWVNESIDSHAFLMAFLYKILFLFVYSAITKDPLDVTNQQLIIETVIGTIFHSGIEALSKNAIIGDWTVPLLYTTILKLTNFAIFGILLFLKGLIRKTEHSQEAYLIQSIGSTVRRILKNEELFPQTKYQYQPNSNNSQALNSTMAISFNQGFYEGGAVPSPRRISEQPIIVNYYSSKKKNSLPQTPTRSARHSRILPSLVESEIIGE